MSTPEERRALFRVVSGDPDDAELAALTAVLAVAAAASPEAPAGQPSAWNDRAAHLRAPLPVGPHAWRTSTWPR
jgi:Acyl-CoA carboxylase epsilon subunit